jgi:hypothetical protein
MITQPGYRAITAGLLLYGVMTMASNGLAQDASVLPDHGGSITVVGCLQRATIKKHDEYILVRPKVGPATSVTEATCTSTASDQAVRLEGTEHLDQSAVGRWIEISGRLEKFENSRELREMRVKSFRAVPVVAAEAAAPQVFEQPAPPQAQVQAQPEPQVTAPVEEPRVATAGVEKRLPHTASSLPLIGLIGVLALAGGLSLRLFGGRTLDHE